MFDSRSAFGFFVHTPLGPLKSGMPDSVEMPAPVNATIRAEAETSWRAVATGSLIRVSLCGILLARLHDPAHQSQAADHKSAPADPHVTDAQTIGAIRQSGNDEQRPNQVDDHVRHLSTSQWNFARRLPNVPRLSLLERESLRGEQHHRQ